MAMEEKRTPGRPRRRLPLSDGNSFASPSFVVTNQKAINPSRKVSAGFRERRNAASICYLSEPWRAVPLSWILHRFQTIPEMYVSATHCQHDQLIVCFSSLGMLISMILKSATSMIFDNTGLVCSWPSEDVLAYYCLSHSDLLRTKKVIELGSGYGLAGLVIAAASEASEVVVSDGNPQVVDYIQHSVAATSRAFGCTRVSAMLLHWNKEDVEFLSGTFDIIVASDCTFFKEFHRSLVRTVKLLLKDSTLSEAIFVSPRSNIYQSKKR